MLTSPTPSAHSTRLKLHRELRVGLMEELALTMKISGYPESARVNLVESVVNCFEKQVERSERGEVPEEEEEEGQ